MNTAMSDLETTTELGDRLAILELIGRLSLTIDAKDWNALGKLFTDTVYHDRTSLTGGDPTTLPVAEFVEGWRQTLQGMDAVHHQITNHVISLNGDEATCVANMQGTHVLANASGGPMWTVGGRHDYKLKRTPGGWRIAGFTFTLQWATGNMNIVTLAMAGGGS
jgi:SnoaL-like domain